MAFVTDPDNLDRNQVVYNTYQKLLYVKGVGALRSGASGSDVSFDASGGTVGAHQVTAASGTPFANAQVGDILIMFEDSQNAGHWEVAAVEDSQNIEVDALAGDKATPVDELTSDKLFAVHAPTGGTVEPAGATLFGDVGVTGQCLYSFTKEEWKADADLIQIEFPFELITREQGEIGGGTENSDWDFGNSVTVELIRTFGWADKATAGTTEAEYTGVITLGSLDDDAQVYYQQQAAGSPTDFVRTGPVNQAILVYTNPTPDYRSYLKLFVRKKGRTYAQSEIADIGVTTIESIVNRFPLAHDVDSAIIDVDAEIDGISPYHTAITADSVTGADVTASTRVVTKAGENFNTTVEVGDIIAFTAGNNSGGYYEVESVDSATQLTLTVASDAEDPLSDDTATASFTVYTKLVRTAATTGTIADVDGSTGTLTDATVANFDTTDSRGVRAVATDDIVVITEAASNHRGAYKVVTRDSATQLTLNTSDREFTSVGSIDYTIYTPGMHLESKEETRSQVGTGVTISFAADGGSGLSTITRGTGSFVTDGYEAGDVIVVANSTSNDGTYTVRSVVALTLTLNSVHTLTDEGGSTTETINGTGYFARSGFAPTEADVFPFKWRLLGNDAVLARDYEFIQRELRRSTDIDEGPSSNVGAVTDALMTYASPTGTGLDLIIDDLAGSDLNNAFFVDATGTTRNYPFIAGVTISLNANLLSDSAANRIVVYFNDPDGTPSSGDEFGTPGAVIVDDKDGVDMDFSNQGSTPISTTFAYDTNSQGGRTPGTTAAVTVVAIGQDNAQYVLAGLTIQRINDNPVSLVAALERNYSNP